MSSATKMTPGIVPTMSANPGARFPPVDTRARPPRSYPASISKPTPASLAPESRMKKYSSPKLTASSRLRVLKERPSEKR